MCKISLRCTGMRQLINIWNHLNLLRASFSLISLVNLQFWMRLRKGANWLDKDAKWSAKINIKQRKFRSAYLYTLRGVGRGTKSLMYIRIYLYTQLAHMRAKFLYSFPTFWTCTCADLLYLYIPNTHYTLRACVSVCGSRKNRALARSVVPRGKLALESSFPWPLRRCIASAILEYIVTEHWMSELHKGSRVARNTSVDPQLRVERVTAASPPRKLPPQWRTRTA